MNIETRFTTQRESFALFKALTSQGHVHQMLTSLVRLAAWCADAPIAGVSATLPDRIESLAVHGVAISTLALSWDYREAGYAPDQFFAAPNALEHPYLSKSQIVRQPPKLRAFLRCPVACDPLPFVVALVVADTKARGDADWPSRKSREMLEEIASLVEAEIAVARDIVRASDGNPTTDPALEDLEATVEASPYPTALLDSELRVHAINAPMAALLRLPREAMVGRGLEDMDFPVRDSIKRLARWSLDGREAISDVAFNLDPEDSEAPSDPAGGTISISLYPLSLSDSHQPALLLRACDISRPLFTAHRLEAIIPPPAPPDLDELGPTSTFLMETLIERSAIRARRDMSYLTLRSWRGPIKDYQIKALRALKAAPPDAFVESIAMEIETAVGRVIGKSAFGAVTPMPCGHSRIERCLSVRIAERVAGRLGVPMVEAFESVRRPGVSHPIDNARRPLLRLARGVEAQVLLVDDVATSGRHLEEAVALLRPHAAAVFPVAWIGGES